MTKVKEKRIARCRKCHKQTAWVYINGVSTLWLCLVCATREETLPQEPPDPREIRAQVKANLDAARGTIARTHAVVDQARKLLHELEESRQLHRAITERRAEQQPRPHSDQPPSPTPQTSDALPEAMPLAEPPTKNGSA